MKQAEVEANRFGNKELRAFAHFFKEEVEKLTDGVSRRRIISPRRDIIEIIQKHGSIDDPKEFFERMHEAGNAIKKSLLAEGKNPRSYIHAMGEFLLKWLETVGDDSYHKRCKLLLQQRKKQNGEAGNSCA